MAMGMGAPLGCCCHIWRATLLADSWADTGCTLSLMFSKYIFQLHAMVLRKTPPATSNRPTGERSTMLSMARKASPK